MDVDEVLSAGPVIPVIVVHEIGHAVPLARALVDGGVRVLEVTLRTPVALAAIRAMRQAVPEAIVGVGTIASAADLDAAREAGAQFGVSPGTSAALRRAIAASGLPFLPGAMTPSEVMTLREEGFSALKLFPAQQAGGLGMLKALASVFADLRFCPTGGIDQTSAPQFLALPNVACVGGSWLAPPALVEAGQWGKITELAKAAAAL